MGHEWNASMSTGIESVDEQHRHLIGLLNQLLRAMEDGRARADVGRILDELRKYAAGHFTHEEACMARYACPAAARNERAHREFASILAAYTDEFERVGPTTKLALRVEDQLVWWLENHIRTVHVELLPCVRLAAAPDARPERIS